MPIKFDNKRKLALIFIGVATLFFIMIGQLKIPPAPAQTLPVTLTPPLPPALPITTSPLSTPVLALKPLNSTPKTASTAPKKASPAAPKPVSPVQYAFPSMVERSIAPPAVILLAPPTAIPVTSNSETPPAPTSTEKVAQVIAQSIAQSTPETPNIPVELMPISVNGSPVSNANLTQHFMDTILNLSDHQNGIPPSHYGHPGFDHLTFLYDIAVNAMMLKMSGHQPESERIMDFFVRRLSISPKQIKDDVDNNNVLGIIKVMRPDAKIIGLVNAFDLHAPQQVGRGQLEFFTTPGPMSFMIMAFLQVNKDKYLPQAIQLGHAILLMQHEDGGIYDGDRFPGRAHTEPHLDAANAFFQLYKATHDEQWKTASDKAVAWFRNNVYQPSSAVIYQGMWEHGPSTIFATDVYSWTMAGFIGDLLSPKELIALTKTMLTKCLTRVNVELPGSFRETIIMADFTDSSDPQVIKKRGGLHPMGSPEWSGGVILALQKNAVRLWNQGYPEQARQYKAMAQYLETEVLKSKYTVDKMVMFPYATGQGIEVGHGWKTPFFFTRDFSNPVAGGSLVGGWPLMPINGFNPFELNDRYFDSYVKIKTDFADRQGAIKYINDIASQHSYVEPVLTKSIDKKTQIIEPDFYNHNAWNAFNHGEYQEAILWAQKVMSDRRWVNLAINEEKLKMQRIGGIIDYPWGTTFENNESPVHFEIQKYPLLNEVGTAMWILANSNLELKRINEAKYWVKRIIQEVPLHQIAHVQIDSDIRKLDLIDGYWNAITSWVYSPSASPRDTAINHLIGEMGLGYNAPREVDLNSTRYPVSSFHS